MLGLGTMKPRKRRRHLNPNTLQLIKRIMGGVLLFIFVGALVWGSWYVSRLPALTIQTVTVEGGETISHELIRTLVWSELDGEYIRLIPKQFAWLYPRSTITTSLQKIGRIKNVSVNLRSSTELVVQFSEHQPDALWCAEAADSCVFLDATGYAFAQAPELSGGSFVRLGKIGVTPVAGVQAFAAETYQRLRAFETLLANQGWYVARIEVDAAGDAYITLTRGGELKVALADEPEQIVANLFTVLNSPEFIMIGPGEFEYIDLRFGNKVFVNELGSPLATSSENELE
jgi:cell division septal protein FtsQ